MATSKKFVLLTLLLSGLMNHEICSGDIPEKINDVVLLAVGLTSSYVIYRCFYPGHAAPQQLSTNTPTSTLPTPSIDAAKTRATPSQSLADKPVFVAPTVPSSQTPSASNAVPAPAIQQLPIGPRRVPVVVSPKPVSQKKLPARSTSTDNLNRQIDMAIEANYI